MSKRLVRRRKRYDDHFCGPNYVPPKKPAKVEAKYPRLRALPPFTDRAEELRKARAR